MKPILAYPVTPVHVKQGFGSNPAYYARFLDKFGNPQKGHMGVDFQASHGQPVHAAHDGIAMYIKDAHGGEGVYVLNKELGYQTIYWHLIGNTDQNYGLPLPFDNGWHDVKTGDLIGYADNTGAPFESLGDHCHFGMQFVDQNGNPLNQDNGFNGCVDPTPFLPLATTETQVQQVATAIQNVDPQSPTTPQQLSLLSQVVEGIKEQLKLIFNL
ncbi:M23 family metallopeptidase [Bradyrhizobium diazoefficiens]|uniref:M23 family metallopeptidase n=1 Tax=Bradyrhizobium diazoefficiens TaxID=1355477 RepID=UPI00190B13D8|nr:M23 family metallopeptidase [Bradyrhizobium diazoefficiens]MBK3666167.1 M23 family metallopeptidase [Bradyrhizobium diazoefficiens]